jgi:hypothetical protein
MFADLSDGLLRQCDEVSFKKNLANVLVGLVTITRKPAVDLRKIAQQFGVDAEVAASLVDLLGKSGPAQDNVTGLLATFASQGDDSNSFIARKVLLLKQACQWIP